MTKTSSAILALALGLATWAGGANAQVPNSVPSYQPTIDITQDPGCGNPLNTAAERIAHNRKLAELYYINFQEDRTRGRNWGWQFHNCLAENPTVLLGAIEPLGAPHPFPPQLAEQGNPELNGEQRGYFSAFPDWGTVPNTLVVVPFEQGAYFRMMYGGHDTDGVYYTIWETNLVLVNDQGKITHFEMWNDTIGFDRTTKKAFGMSLLDMGKGDYGAVFDPQSSEAPPASGQ